MSRFALATFCDDIRQEAGGKLSLMGIYQGDLLVPASPTVLPKLCIVIHVSTASAQPFKTLTVRVQTKDRILMEQTVPPEALAQIDSQLRANADPDDPFTRISLVAHLALSPFLVDQVMTLKAEAVIDGEVFPAGRLKVGFAAEWPPMHGSIAS